MSRSFLYSLLLHVGVITLLLIGLPSFTRNRAEMTPVPLYIDLKNVQITAKTNLPEANHKTPKKEEVKKTVETKSEPKPAPTAKPVEEKNEPEKTPEPTPIVKDAVEVQEEKPAPKKKPVKPAPKKKAPEKTTTTQKKETKEQEDWQKLLASIDAVKKKPDPLPVKEAEPTETQASQSEGQTSAVGLSNQPLTLSERDFIASKLRSCWSVDAGQEGIENMIIQIRVFVGRDGRVLDAKILNMTSDPAFRTVAERARRAIYICDGLGSESPFKILSEQHPETFDMWKEILLRFNPVDGGVF